jgi:hypothetical protein
MIVSDTVKLPQLTYVKLGLGSVESTTPSPSKSQA